MGKTRTFSKKKNSTKNAAKTKNVRKSRPQLFRVDTNSAFQLSYLIEAKTADDAAAWVEQAVHLRAQCGANQNNNVKPMDEWQQKWLGERVVEVENITLKQAKREHVKKNPNLWNFAPLPKCIINAQKS